MTRSSSASSLAAKVTLKRIADSASSHGTVEMNFSRMSHCESP